MTRYVVLGAGAVGCAIGAMLAANVGREVVLIARGAHLDALRRDGLRIDAPSRSYSLRLRAEASAREAEIREGDVIVLATKSQDSEGALRALAEVAPRSVPVACAQNGVENEPLAARWFDRVMGLVVYAPLALVAPGHVTSHSEPVMAGLDLGLYPEGADDLTRAFVRDLVDAGFDARADVDVMKLKHGKLLSNLGNVVEALAGRSGLALPLLGALHDEAIACFTAAGIAYTPLAEVYARYASIRSLPVQGADRGGGSTWQSLARRTGAVETSHLNGAIVRIGERHGVPTPYNRAVTVLAERAAREGLPPEHWSAAELVRAIDALPL